MTLSHRVVVAVFRGLTDLLFRIDGAQLARVPERGPLILVANHVHILEIPLLYARLQPRPVTGLVWADRWNNRLLRWLLDVMRSIPLHRGEADVGAIRKALERLKSGDIVVIDPEGTRSGNGCLQKAHPGVVLLALHSGAPLLPVVHYGSEGYRENVRRLRRSDFHIAVGKPFKLNAHGAKVTRQMRRQMVDEVMYQMAALLPLEYRDVYADPNAATEKYLDFQ